MPQSRLARRTSAAAVALTLGTLPAGCSAPVRPEQPALTPSPVLVSTPADGLTLRQLGFGNGPADAFSLPRSVRITTSVDQPTGVTVVMDSPSPTQVTDYLRRALPATGFDLTAVDAASTSLTFTGYGWRGSFTGSGQTSAVTLRP